MAKNYKDFDDSDGVWRTVGGRRIFIRNGQDLASAMVESGKFKNLRSTYKKQKEKDEAKEDKKDLVEKEEKTISDSDKKMLRSIFAYSDEKNPEDSKYYKELEEKYGKDAVEKEYKALQDKYDVVKETYTDSEGVTYNTLKEKESASSIKQKDDINSESKFMEKRRKEIALEREKGVYDGERHTDEKGNYKYQKELDAKEKSTKWQDEIKANNDRMEKDVTDLQNQINDFRNRSYQSNDALERYQLWKEAEKLQDKYYERFRENERANAKIKAEHNEPNDKYMNVDAYAGYKDKFNQTWGEDGSGDKTVSAKMYTNDEFMEHLEDANWHSERKALLDANLTNKELEYIKDRTKVSAWGVENLTGKEQVDKLIKEAKSQSANQSMNNAIREKAGSKYYEGTKRLGFGYANDDNIPVYQNKIDYSGDFTHANLSKVSDDDLVKIANKQNELYNEAVGRQVGDRRTYNGKKDQIFKDTETLRYGNGLDVVSSEMEKRGLKADNQITNTLREKAYKKYLKEHPESKMSFNEFKDMKK